MKRITRAFSPEFIYSTILCTASGKDRREGQSETSEARALDSVAGNRASKVTDPFPFSPMRNSSSIVLERVNFALFNVRRFTFHFFFLLNGAAAAIGVNLIWWCSNTSCFAIAIQIVFPPDADMHRTRRMG